MDLQPYTVNCNKENSRAGSSKEHLKMSSSVRPSVVRCLDFKAPQDTPENRLKPSSDPVTRTIRKCTGFELTLHQAPPVAVAESRGVSTPLGTSILLYTADSLQSGDSSLASLSSLIHNVVCSSHGTIMKPLSSSPGVSSASAMHSARDLVDPNASQGHNGTLRRTAAAALPVLSSQLTAGKPVLIPFHIRHMNYLNNVTKYPNTCSSLVPLITSTMRPVEPSISLLQPMKQKHVSQLYHPWRPAAYENGSTSKPALRLSHLRTATSMPGVNIMNTNNRKNDVRLPSAGNVPRLKSSKDCSKSEPVHCQPIILIDKLNYNSQLKASVNTNDRVSSSCSTTITLASDYVPTVNGATRNPHKKILTSLLSGKTQVHDKNLLAGGNSQDSSIIRNEAALSDISCTYKATPSTACVSSSGYKATPSTACVSSSGYKATPSTACVSSSGYKATPSTTCVSSSGYKATPSTACVSSSGYKATPSTACVSSSGYKATPSTACVSSSGYKATPSTTCVSSSGYQATPSTACVSSSGYKATPSTACVSSSGYKATPSTACVSSSGYKATPSTACVSSTRGSERSAPGQAKKSSVRLPCFNCDQLFFSGTDLLIHRYEQHGHVCGECDGRFLSSERLSQHKEADHPAIMICPLCRFHTFNKQGLIDHQRLEHCLEMDSSGNSNTATNQIIKVSNQVNLTKVIVSHSGEEILPGNTQNSSPGRERTDLSVARIETNETSGFREVCVYTTKSPDNLQNKDCKRVSSSPYSKSDCQLLSKPNGPVFTSLGNELIVRQNSADISPSCANFGSREHCKSNHVPSGEAEQHFSESDEPKLVIDTDKCRTNVGHERRTRRKRSLRDSKVELELGQCQDQKRKANKGLKRRKKQNPSEELKVEKTGSIRKVHSKEDKGMNDIISVNKEIRDIMSNANIPLDILKPNEFRVNLQIKPRQSPAVLIERNSIANSFDRTFSTCGLPGDAGSSFNSKAELGNARIIDEPLIPINKLYPGRCLDAHHTGPVPTAEPCGRDGAKQCNINSPTHCSEPGNKLQHRTTDLCADGQSFSNATTVVVERPLTAGHATKQPLAREERLLPLRERHAQNSLPPKKRKIFSCFGQPDIIIHLPTLTDSNYLGTNVIQQNCNSINIQENRNQRTHSINDKFVSTLGSRALSNTCSKLSQSQQQTDRRYPCPVSNCAASFSRKWNLDGHINKVHTKFATVTCSVPGCQQAFTSKRDLRQHVTVDHKGKSRRFQCSWPECNKSFFARTHLRIHTLTHTGEKPVACDICDYRCRQRTALMWHMRKHEASPRS